MKYPTEKKQADPSPERPFSTDLFLCLLLGWFLVSFFFLGLQNFHPIYNPSPGVAPGLFHRLLPWFWAGLGLLILGFKFMPPGQTTGDVGKTASRLSLLLILGLAAFLRLFNAGAIPGHYWNDFALTIGDASQLTDYQARFICAPFQMGEPLYSYAMAAVLRFFPHLGGIFIQRLVLALFDLAAIWIFYLVGKEFGKRRIGLLMASFGAASKVMIIMSMSCMRFGTIHLPIALVLLFSMRLFRKPSARHFLQWGAALALGFYTYTAFRPLALFFVLAVFGWAFFRGRERPRLFSEWVFGWGLAGWVVVLFLYQHRFSLAEQSILRTSIVTLVEKGIVFPLFTLVLAWAFFENALAWVRKKSDGVMLNFGLGVVLMSALLYPLFTRAENIASRLTASFILTRLSPDSHLWDVFGFRIFRTFQTLFYTGMDRGDINLYGDPFFGLTDLIFIFPGILLIVLKPSWKRLFILSAALVGMVPHIMTDPGGNRLVACVVPFLLVGALGFNQILEAASRLSKPAFGRALVMALWLGLLVFGALTTFEKVHFHFIQQKYRQYYVAEQIRKDSTNARVYGSYDEFTPVGIMNETYPCHWLLMDSNPVFLEPSDKAPDVVVLLEENNIPEAGLVEKLKSQFPKAPWEKIRINPDDPNELPVYLLRMSIPAGELSEDPSKLIHVKRVPKIRWTRKYYPTGYKMGYGVIVAEDKVAELSEPFPPGIRDGSTPFCDPSPSMRCETVLDVPKAGRYSFAIETEKSNTDLWLGDDRIMRLRPNRKIRLEKSVTLSKGSYHVMMTANNRGGLLMPKLFIREPGSNEWKLQ